MKAKPTHSIVIGSNLKTDKSYHLLVDANGIKIDKIMSKEEHQMISNLLKAVL